MNAAPSDPQASDFSNTTGTRCVLGGLSFLEFSIGQLDLAQISFMSFRCHFCSVHAMARSIPPLLRSGGRLIFRRECRLPKGIFLAPVDQCRRGAMRVQVAYDCRIVESRRVRGARAVHHRIRCVWDTKRKAWPIAKPKGAVATPAAPLEFSIYFDAGATVTPRSCLLSQEELNGSLKRNYRTFLDSGPLAT